MNGDQQERDLMRCLAVLDWAGLRSPASGTAPREQPDVMAAKRGVILVAELKSGVNPRNPTDAEIRDLSTFADAFGGAAVIAARYKGDRTFYLAPPEALARTNSGNYSIPNAPERLPWSAKIQYTIDHDLSDPDVDGPVYHATAIQQDVPDDAPMMEDPLRAWTSNVAQAQIAGAATSLFDAGAADADVPDGGDG